MLGILLWAMVFDSNTVDWNRYVEDNVYQDQIDKRLLANYRNDIAYNLTTSGASS